MDKKSYSLGMSMAHNLLQSNIRELVIEDYVKGFTATFTGKQPEISYEEAADILDRYFKELEQEQNAQQSEIADAMRKEGEEFLSANALKEGVVSLPSGLQYKVLKEGSGRKPLRSDKVLCHYEGRFINGQVFDSSFRRNEPATFGLTQVISGWTEVLQLMSEGSTWEVYIPYGLAYGEDGAQGAIPPCATLIFKIELLRVL